MTTRRVCRNDRRLVGADCNSQAVKRSGQRFQKRWTPQELARISAANYLEPSIVVDGWKNPVLSREFDELIERFNIRIEPVTVEQAKIARQAYRDFGQRQRASARG